MVVGWHVALVAKKEESLVPRKVGVLSSQERIEGSRGRTAGESHRKASALGDGGAANANEFFRGSVEEFGRRGKDFDDPNARHTFARMLLAKVAGALFFEISPRPAIAFQQFVRVFRSPPARRIVREITRRQRFPYIEHRSDDAPSRLDHVGTLK